MRDNGHPVPTVEDLRDLYANMTIGVVFQDADGSIRSANPAAERILGLSLDQLRGRTSMDPRWRAVSRSGQDIDGAGHPAMVALATGRPVHDFLMGVFKPEAEEYVWIAVNAFPHLSGAEADGVFVTFEDVTEKLWAEDALRASEARFRSLFDNMLHGVAIHEMVLDAEGRPIDYVFLSANESFGRLTGLEPSAIVGKRVMEIIPDLEPEYLRRYGRVVATGESIVFESEAAALCRRYLISAFKTGERQFATIFDDITERAKATAELSRAAEERRALFRELEHRVKNSLALIAGLVKLEADRTRSEEARATLIATSNRISSISALYEQLYRGDDSLEIRMDAYLDRILRGIEGAYAPGERGIALRSEAEPLGLPAGRATPLGIIVNELVTNSLKHGFPDGEGGSIELRLSLDGGVVELEVADDGVGLPEGFSFEEGEGFGARIAALLAQQLGGTIATADRPKGSAFLLRFPAEPAAPSGAGAD